MEVLILERMSYGDSLNNIILPSAPRLYQITLGDPDITSLDLGFLDPVKNAIQLLNLDELPSLTGITNVNNIVLSHLTQFYVSNVTLFIHI